MGTKKDLQFFKKPGQFSDLGVASPEVTYYYGFDISIYPGDTQMSAFWTNTPFWYTGFYLGPVAHRNNDISWMNKRTYLKNLGYGFLVIYFGRQQSDSGLTFSQGQTDADNAHTLASNAGFPSGTYIFLDVEDGGTLSAAYMNYISGWVQRIDSTATPYWAGIYSSYYQTADQIKNALSGYTLKSWCYNVNVPPSSGCNFPTTAPNPANCGVSYAAVWQLATNCSKTYNSQTLSIDVDTALSQNPSVG